jgi:hypothetical protein
VRPSGLAESPLPRIGLAVLVLGNDFELPFVELLEKLGLRRLGMMRTMVTAGGGATATIY